MADIKSLLSAPSFMDVAYQDAFQQELANQAVQQKIKSLQEEAMYRSQMQPYEIQNKQATTDFLRAQADRMRREPQELNAERLAKAEQLKRNDSMLRDYASLQRMLATGSPHDFENIYPTLSPDTQRFFSKPGVSDTSQRGAWEYSPELIKSAISTIEKTHPELAKTLREDIRGGHSIEKQRMADETRLRVEEMKRALTAAGEDKAGSNFQQQGNKFYNEAVNMPEGPAKQAKMEQAQYFFNLAMQLAQQGALARAAGKPDLSQIGNIPVNPPPSPVAAPPGMKPKYDMSKY